MMARMSDVTLFSRLYTQPKLGRGGRTFWLYRVCDVKIISWTDAPIPWPRCRLIDSLRGQPSPLVDDELARAIRTESAVAIKFWWGVGTKAVWQWRKAFEISRYGTPGSNRLQRMASALGADKVRDVPLLPEVVEQRRQSAIRL